MAVLGRPDLPGPARTLIAAESGETDQNRAGDRADHRDQQHARHAIGLGLRFTAPLELPAAAARALLVPADLLHPFHRTLSISRNCSCVIDRRPPMFRL